MCRKLLLNVILTVFSYSGFAQTACEPFPMTKVRLLPSRFQDNMRRDSAWIASIPIERLLHSFRTTAGIYTGREGGYMTVDKLGGWESLDCDLRGHTTGHLLSAMAYLQMKEKADSLVQGLRSVQEHYGTGFLAAFGEGLIDRNIRGESVWAPFYTLHKLLQGLIDQYVLCDNETALQIAIGMGDWAYNKLNPLSEETRKKMLRNEFGGFNDAMYQLYSITHDKRHLWVARFFYHNDKIDPLKEGNSDLGSNHANTFIPKLIGECRNYELFGDRSSRNAATLLFNTLINEHIFVTGEVSDKEHLFSPTEQSKHLSGYDGENCCTYNLLKLAEHIFTYQPKSYIADYYERALFNHVLGQQDTISSMVCYFTPLQTGAFRLLSTPDSSFWCCVGSGFESHAKYQSAIYYQSHKTLYVNLFIPSEVEWDGLIIRQKTVFPKDNKTLITIAPHTSPFTLKLRYPYWATYMKVNGRKKKAGKDGYADITITPNPVSQQTIKVEWGMTLHEESTKDDATLVALMYGPIVMAGRLATVPQPFSDSRKYNDYYTFDYGRHPEVMYKSVLDFKPISPLVYIGPGAINIEPFYNMQRCRYVVYWRRN